MTTQLSWLEASRLNVGDRVVFVDAHDIFPEALVPAGTRATVTEQGLNEISSALAVMPDDAELQAKLAEWDGEVILSPPLDREGSGNREQAWSEASPLAKVPMTFEQFQATRRWCDDLGAAIADARWQGEPPATVQSVPRRPLYEAVQAHWPEATEAQGKWHLIIGRDEWVSDDLTMLEKHLYDFAMEEGYGD